MARPLILSLFFLVWFGTAGAQSASIKLGQGENYTDRNRTETSSFLIDGKRYVIFKYFEAPSFQYHLFIYNSFNTLKHSGDFTYPMGTFGNAFYVNNFIAFNNKLWFLKDHLDKGGKTSTLIAQEVTADGAPDSKETVLSTHVYEKMLNVGGYKEAVSPNGELLAILTDVPWVKDQAPALTITVYDKGLNKKWSKDYTLNEPMDKGPNYELTVADNGAVYFVKSRVINNAPMMLKAMAVTEPGGELKNYDIKLPAPHKISDYKMTVDADNSLILAGVYNDDKSITVGEPKIPGTWFCRVTGKGEPEVKPAAFDKPIELLKSTTLLVNNGAYILGSEQQKVTSGAMTGSSANGRMEMSTPETYEYIHNNGQITAYDADGNVKFNTTIEKSNKSTDNDFYDGIYFFINNGKLVALYADDITRYAPQEPSGRVPVLVSFSSTGQADAPLLIYDIRFNGLYRNMLYLGSPLKTNSNELFVAASMYGSKQIQPAVIKW